MYFPLSIPKLYWHGFIYLFCACKDGGAREIMEVGSGWRIDNQLCTYTHCLYFLSLFICLSLSFFVCVCVVTQVEYFFTLSCITSHHMEFLWGDESAHAHAFVAGNGFWERMRIEDLMCLWIYLFCVFSHCIRQTSTMMTTTTTTTTMMMVMI